MPTKLQSCHCNKQKFSIATGLFIALLPKCHFCILAYSSAITLCSGTTLYHHTPIWTSYISVFLSLFTFLLVLWNFRGIRTIIAGFMVIVGCFLISYSELKTGELTYYYWGTVSLLTGVWVNGSFYYFFRKFMRPFVTTS